MNIFYLDKNPRTCATMHLDKHCVKMILEYAQLLSTAHRVCDGDSFADTQEFYKATHINHPSAIFGFMNCYIFYVLNTLIVMAKFIKFKEQIY